MAFLDLPLPLWLLLAGLAYAVVTAILYVCATWVGHHTERHDLAVQLRERQLAKRRAQEAKRAREQANPLGRRGKAGPSGSADQGGKEAAEEEVMEVQPVDS